MHLSPQVGTNYWMKIKHFPFSNRLVRLRQFKWKLYPATDIWTTKHYHWKSTITSLNQTSIGTLSLKEYNNIIKSDLQRTKSNSVTFPKLPMNWIFKFHEFSRISMTVETLRIINKRNTQRSRNPQTDNKHCTSMFTVAMQGLHCSVLILQRVLGHRGKSHRHKSPYCGCAANQWHFSPSCASGIDNRCNRHAGIEQCQPIAWHS